MAKLKKFSNTVPTMASGEPAGTAISVRPTEILIYNSVNVHCINADFSLDFAEEENVPAETETPAPSKESPKNPASKVKAKKPLKVKADLAKGKVSTNGTVAKNLTKKPKDVLKKKGLKDGKKKPKVVKEVAEAAKELKAEEKNEGSKFEKKLNKKRKNPIKKTNRMGKNKFKKFKKMLSKEEVA